jgi:1-acyl-sn-glycerol-3-phosphate acyltransferase
MSCASHLIENINKKLNSTQYSSTSGSSNEFIFKKILRKFGLIFFRINAKYSETSVILINEGVVVCSNHVSLIDGIIIALTSPRPMFFAVTTEYSRKFSFSRLGLKFLETMGFGRVIPIDSSSPFGIRILAKELQRGESVMIFPEGKISDDGNPLPIQPGVLWLAERTNVRMVEVRINGAEKSRFFSKSGKSFFPKIFIEYL